MLNDLRYALRMLRKNPGFTAVAVLTLALGIGANTAIFSLIHALILRELPVREPDRLVALSTITPKGQTSGLSYPMFEEFRRHQMVFSGLFAWSGGGVSTLEAEEAMWPGTITSTTGDYYSTLGVAPLIGRAIMPEDEGTQGRPPNYLAVISYACWQQHYGGDPAVVGKIIRIEGNPYTIVGVTPKDFSSLAVSVSEDVTVPLIASNSLESLRRGKFLSLDVIGRLKQGISLEQARMQLEALWPSVQTSTVSPDWNSAQKEEFLSYRLKTASAATGAGYIPLRQRFSQPLWVLMGIASLVLLIACANLASLLLARAAARQREMGVRVALGAGEWRLIRQLLIESVLLSIAGALPGIFFAWWASRLLACVGLYGLMSYIVGRRTTEIGIRMALGAQPSDVLWLVLREMILLVLIGVVIGLPVAFASTQLISSQLFGLTPTDPVTISMATLLLIAVAAFAGYLPARRASRVDPMVELRHE